VCHGQPSPRPADDRLKRHFFRAGVIEHSIYIHPDHHGRGMATACSKRMGPAHLTT
jgi:predicted GNAT family acetyltransferase